MICRGTAGQRCAGTLTLKATSRESRLKAAAAGRARFSVAAGRSAKTIRVEPTRALRARLRKRGKAVAELTATMRGDGATRRPLKRLITVHARRLVRAAARAARLLSSRGNSRGNKRSPYASRASADADGKASADGVDTAATPSARLRALSGFPGWESPWAHC